MKIRVNTHISNSIMRLMVYIYLGYLMLSTVLTELQLMVIGNIVLKGSHIALLTLPLALAKLVFACVAVDKLRKKYLLVVLFILYIFFVSIYYAVLGKADIATIASFLFSKAMPIIIVMSIGLQRKDLRMKGLFRFFEVVALVNAVAIIIQFATNDILWPYLVDNDGNPLFWSVNSADFNRLRPPGIMNSALSAGYISLIWLCLVLYQYQNGVLRQKKVLFKGALCLFTIFATQTRNIYFAAFFIIVYMIIAPKLEIKRRNFMPIFSVGASAIYYLLFSVIGKSATSNEGVFSIASSAIRWRNWSFLGAKFQEQDIFEKLFGIMKWQAIAIDEVFSDSLYFDLVFSIGLIGLILYLAINFRLQKSLCLAKENTVLIAAMVGSLLFIGIANIPSASYESTVLIMAALIINRIDCNQGAEAKERLDANRKNKASSS